MIRRRAKGYDNAKAKSFMKILKVEAVYLDAYRPSRTSPTISRFIDKVYNSKRLHSVDAQPNAVPRR